MNQRAISVIGCCIVLLMAFSIICNAQEASGTAVIAIRMNTPPGFGHIGVGYQNSNGNYICGAIEGKNSNPNIQPGGDNGAWIKAYKTHMSRRLMPEGCKA